MFLPYETEAGDVYVTNAVPFSISDPTAGLALPQISRKYPSPLRYTFLGLKMVIRHNLVFAPHSPTNRRISFFCTCPLGFNVKGLVSFCNWARRRTLHNDLVLTVASDDDGVLFREERSETELKNQAFFAGSLEPFKAETFRPVNFKDVDSLFPLENLGLWLVVK